MPARATQSAVTCHLPCLLHLLNPESKKTSGMFLFAIFLLSSAKTTEMSKPLTYDTIIVSQDQGHLIGSWDCVPLLNAINSLQLLTSQIKDLKSLFAHPSLPFKQPGFQSSQDRMISWLVTHVDSSLDHIRSRLRNLGFKVDPTSPIRHKRAPLAFIGHLQSSIFGTIDEDQFNNLKNYVQRNFKLVHNESSQIRGLVADNRAALLKTLKVVETNSRRFIDEANSVVNHTQIVSRFFQCSFALSSIERIVLMLESIKTSADGNMISRQIMTPSILRSHILKLSDKITGVSPIFNSDSLGLYYKLKLSVSTVSDSEITQLISIPMMSIQDMYTLSHAKCHDAHVCLESASGMVTLPLTDYLLCYGVTSRETPTICPFRACLSSQIAVCRMINTTTAIVSTSTEFEAFLNCNNHYNKKLIVANITIINIPVHCSISGPNLKIRPIRTMTVKEHFHTAVFVPFQLTDNDLILDTSNVDPGVIPHLAMKSVRDLLASKIKRTSTFPEELENFDFLTHGKLSVAAISSSSVLILIFAGLVIAFCILWKRN